MALSTPFPQADGLNFQDFHIRDLESTEKALSNKHIRSSSKHQEAGESGTSVSMIPGFSKILLNLLYIVVAYFTQDSLDLLLTVDDHPQLASLAVPIGKYKSARSVKTNRQQHDLFMLPSYQYGSPYPSHAKYMVPGPAYGSEQPHAPLFMSNSPESRRALAPSAVPPTRGATDILAPLEYLQNVPPPRRHPLDEEALMSFTIRSWTI